MRIGNIINKYSKILLEKKHYAIGCAVAFSVIPFTLWLSLAVIALITLRKGVKPGFEVMLPALVAHSIPLMMLVPINSVLINAFIAYLPCYLASICLRTTVRWHMVFGLFFILAFSAFVSVQILAPDFALEQFRELKKVLAQYEGYQHILGDGTQGFSSTTLAQLLFGIQILSVVTSAMVSLLFARAIQSNLFNPNGLKEELLGFRSGRLAFLLLICVSIASYHGIACAINLMPIVLSYFLISGFNLAYFALAGKKQSKVVALLFLLILIKPSFVILAYLILGSLDSLFNFRLYLPARVREST